MDKKRQKKDSGNNQAGYKDTGVFNELDHQNSLYCALQDSDFRIVTFI